MEKFDISIIIRSFFFIAFLLTSFILFKYTAFHNYFTKDGLFITINAIRQLIDQCGSWGVVLYLLTGLLAITFNVPTILIIAISVTIFGKVAGGIIAAIIVYAGISLIYWIAQTLGRPFVKSLFNNGFHKIEKRLRNNGLMTVVYLRLVFFMAPVLNWILCVTSISYKNMLLGTIIGTVHNIIIFSWLSGVVVDLVRTGGSLNPLNTPQLLLPICIGGIIFIVARIIDSRHRSDLARTEIKAA